MHCSCYKIVQFDFKFIKNCFKCTPCLSKRRGSLPSSSAVVVANRKGAASVSKTSSADAALPTVTSKNPNLEPSASDVHDREGGVSVSVASKNKRKVVLKASSSLDDLVAPSSNADLKFIINELNLLKSENAKLCSLVSLLRDDNVSLRAEISDLKTGFDELLVCMPKPKAKKNTSSAKPNVLSVNKPAKKQSESNAINSINNVPALNKRNTNASSVIELSASSSSSNNNLAETNFEFCSATGTASNGNTYAQVLSGNTDSYSGNYRILPAVSVKKKTIIGINDNMELGVISKKKWLHLSSFKNDVTADNIIEYLVKHTGINAVHFTCHSLIKKNADIDSLTFVNFKLGVAACYYDIIFDANLWNANVKIRPFRFLAKEPSPTMEAV